MIGGLAPLLARQEITPLQPCVYVLRAWVHPRSPLRLWMHVVVSLAARDMLGSGPPSHPRATDNLLHPQCVVFVGIFDVIVYRA
jgi:hypothetical protein